MNTSFSERMHKAVSYARTHKVVSTLVVLGMLYLGYSEYKSLTSTTGETRYVLSSVTRGTIVTSISGSGQVTSFNQLDLKPKASGEVTWIGVQAGDVLRAGQAISAD